MGAIPKFQTLLKETENLERQNRCAVGMVLPLKLMEDQLTNVNAIPDLQHHCLENTLQLF